VKVIRLSIERFRSYERLELTFPKGNQFFLGPNGSGKTNLIEALSLLSLGKSCLRADPEDMVRFGEDFFRLRVVAELDGGKERTLEYVWQSLPRRQSATFVDDIRTPLLQFIGALPTVTFLPEDLALFSGPPAKRRAFLDMLLSQLEPSYAGLRIEYERLLKQRGALLRRIADRVSDLSELDLWDERLAEAGAKIQARRSAIAAGFTADIGSVVKSLGEGALEGSVFVYERSTTSSDVKSIVSELRTLLRSSRDRDILLQSTSAGPHRDDWHILESGRPIERFLSRGQQRSYLVALILESAALLGEARSEKPIILLDDVLSELDDHHQDALLTSLRDHQVLVTSAHPVREKGLTVWHVGEGRVTKA
jgi:DNA replication and repair protein RecF